MHIFTQEIKDGIAEQIATSNSLAFELVPSIVEITQADIKLSETDTTSDNSDLLYFNSVLASVGWNKNDDVFDSKELWRAKSTPVNKKINFMHNEKDIIGHMTKSNVLDYSGRYLPDDVQELDLPDGFDVVVGGYLYKFWQDPILKERMSNIVDMVNNQKIAVSMECIFPNFDYAIITPDNQNKVIGRDESTAFLTKHLKSYGGAGHYENYRIGRLLRGMVFTGNALVDKPANPRSLILKKDAIAFNGSMASINIFSNKMEINTCQILPKSSMMRLLNDAKLPKRLLLK